MTDIFEEVDEALKKEKFLKIWEDYKTTIIASIALLVLGTGAGTAYKNWDFNRNQAETGKIFTALTEEQNADSLISIAENTRSNHKVIALFNAAHDLKQNTKMEEAAKLYQDIIDTRSAPQNLRDLARVLYAQIASDNALPVLQPVLADKDSPWLWHARIEAALQEAKADNYAGALSHLKDFETVTSIPLSLKQRGNALRKVYTLKQTQSAS